MEPTPAAHSGAATLQQEHRDHGQCEDEKTRHGAPHGRLTDYSLQSHKKNIETTDNAMRRKKTACTTGKTHSLQHHSTNTETTDKARRRKESRVHHT